MMSAANEELPGHAVLLVIRFDERRMEYYDSLGVGRFQEVFEVSSSRFTLPFHLVRLTAPRADHQAVLGRGGFVSHSDA